MENRGTVIFNFLSFHCSSTLVTKLSVQLVILRDVGQIILTSRAH